MAKDVRRALMIAKAKGGALDTAPYYPPGSKQHEDNKRNFLKDSAVQHPVYHGSWQDIPEFKRTNKSPGFTALGHWFTSEPPEASSFAGAGFSDDDRKRMHPTSGAGSVYPVHLAIKNPLEFSSAKEFWDWAKDYALRYGHGNKAEGEGTRDWGSQWVTADPDAIRERLHLGNKDGIIIRGGGEADNYPTKGDWFIALHPHQIKSAIGNRGTFDPNEADIGKAAGGSATKRALMIARDQRALLRRIANIYPAPGGGMDPTPGGGGYSGPGGGKYIGPSHYADGGSVPPFKLHSGAAKIIKSKGQAKATPQQYAAMPGIKPDELKHSKFDTMGSKALPREEVIKHLEDNALPLQETQLGGEGRNTSTKFDSYQLPGGKNYREVLLHTPKPREFATVDEEDNVVGRFDNYISARDATTHGSREGLSVAVIKPNGDIDYDKNPAHHVTDSFQSDHWDEPDVLAHVRMSDRRGPNGEKILHLEEAQSDWGQQGRDQGFNDPALEEKLRIARDEANQRVEDARTALRQKMGHGRELEEKLEPLLTEHRKAYQAHIAAQKGLPQGPYVDNTQKWTDLALKRVLHEAAHGGYDKIVVTPGDEQNKRYDLSKHISALEHSKNLNGTYRVDAHLPEGNNHLLGDEIAEKDLATHVGKEVAKKIVNGEGQAHPSVQGKLLSGLDLQVGGAGMRGYYDNILPKRLQALAQQHDPQAKVNLHAHDINPPLKQFSNSNNIFDRLDEESEEPLSDNLHSLDVTPQMRDSIKANGFNSFKRGGEVEDPIKNWQWRPTDDVRNELQLDEIPSHVHKFGEFMDESARKAMNEGFTPRDLIKAYTITRASIQRRARPVEAIRKSGLILPPDLKGVLRPEGAFGHWLHTKHGQRYLDEAEAGRVDEEAIADAQKIMKPYGKTKIDLPDALRWAPKNLPGQEGRISELVTRAYRGHDHPDDWRDATSGLKGIGPAKKGFYGANLGYGKLPTLDAREITVHTGRPTKEATPYLRKKGAADAAVDRLADRQTELGLKHDKSMSPFYQHLTHHTVWDKASGETTTHDDLMHPMRNAKDGGRQGYKTGGAPPTIGHPLAHGLLEAFPEGFKDVPEEHLRQMLRNPFTDATEKEVRAALHTSPATHNLLYRASQLTGHSTQKLMQHLLPSGGPKEPGRMGITSLRQPDLIERAMATITPNRRIAVAKPRPMTPEELFNMRAVSVAGMSDRSPAGFDVSGADMVDFGENISALGGNDFNLMPRSIKYGIGWAGARAPITGMGNAAREKLKEVKEKYGIDAQPLLTTKLMSLQSNDQTHMVMRAASHLLRNAPITDADAEAFNEYVRNQRPAAKQGVIQPPYMPDFPGIKHGKLYDYLMKQKMPNRTALIKAMDKGAWNKKGIPNPASIRMAFTKPELIVAPEGTPGAMFATMDPGNPHYTGDSGHGSYPVGATGKNVGGLDRIVPKEAFHQTYFDQPKVKAKVAAGKNADVMSGYIKSPVTQYHDQEWLDRIMPIYENAPPFRRAGGRAGYAPGGGVEQLQQNLHQSFSDLNRQVAAQGPQQQQAMPQAPYGAYQRMERQATGQAPNDAYQRMMAQALNGKTYEEMFPTSPKVAAPAVAPVQLAAADAMPYYQTNYGPSPTEILGGDGSSSGAADAGGGTGGAGAAGADGSGGDGGASSSGGGSAYRYGGQTIFRRNGVKKSNIVERALAVTRRK